jgi:mRNA interferase RelE/StbE
MRLEFKASFARDLRRIKDEKLLRQVREGIEQLEAAESILQIENLKKLRGEGRYFRIRLRDYRLGLIAEGDTITLVRFLHRSDIYRYFP